MKATAKQIGYILLTSAALSAGVNAVRPRSIPWVQDWSRQVEELAVQQNINVSPLPVALGKHRSGESIFVDARSADHFAQGHISGAVSVPFDQFEDCFSVVIDLIDSGRELVVYCRNRECDDALMLAAELQALGASNLMLYVDGIELWEEHGGPISLPTADRKDTGDDL
jgi:rhodanese-related sulfurtransferase